MDLKIAQNSRSLRSSRKIERTLIFDVETNGLPQKSTDLSKQPFIIQISFIVINVIKINNDISEYKTLYEFNHYVRIENHIEISKKISELTEITKEKCINEGVPITYVLSEFYKEYIKADCVVSHNIEFDSKMILFEMERNYINMMLLGCQTPYAIFNPMFNRMNGIKIYCTMSEGRNLTNIMVSIKEPTTTSTTTSTTNDTQKPSPRTYKKNPKLIELYRHLYPENCDPIGLHDSMVDTRVCMECYIKMKL
jgi:DNA polymerase III epsilon subunit-like protein